MVAGFQISLSHLLSVATKEIIILFSNIKEKHLHQLKIQVVMVSYPPLKSRGESLKRGESLHNCSTRHFQARNTVDGKSRGAGHSLDCPSGGEAGAGGEEIILQRTLDFWFHAVLTARSLIIFFIVIIIMIPVSARLVPVFVSLLSVSIRFIIISINSYH